MRILKLGEKNYTNTCLHHGFETQIIQTSKNWSIERFKVFQVKLRSNRDNIIINLIVI